VERTENIPEKSRENKNRNREEIELKSYLTLQLEAHYFMIGTHQPE
jgi:hypothetical protein